MTAKQLKALFAAVFAAVALATASAFGALYLFGYIGNSAARISREHGLKLPSSSHNFVCRGDAWMHTFMDSGAASAFEMASGDLPGFVSQLKMSENSHQGFGEDNILPANSQYQIHRRWMSGAPLKTYHCNSPTGEWLDVQIWATDDAHVSVVLYTDWN